MKPTFTVPFTQRICTLTRHFKEKMRGGQACGGTGVRPLRIAGFVVPVLKHEIYPSPYFKREPSPMADSASIHIVDDEEDLARNLRDILELHHYSVTISHSCSSAIEHLRENPVELAIIDMNLPDRKGEDLIRELSLQSPTTEFIVLTGHASIESAIDAVKHRKIVAYEIKPVHIGHLLTLLTQVFKRRESERQQNESERRFREAIDNVELLSIMLDTEGNVTYCNECLLSLVGRSREAVIGTPWFDNFVPPEQLTQQQFLHFIQNNNIPVHFENDVIGRRGERRRIAWGNTVMKDEHGTIAGTFSIGSDITEKATALQELEWKAQADETIAEISRTLLSAESISLRDISDTILARSSSLTGSTQGMVGYTDGERNVIISPSFTEAMAPQAHRAGNHVELSIAEGFWAELLRERRPIIRNSQALDMKEEHGEGHTAAKRLIVAPALLGGTLAGMISLANKPVDYDERDLSLIESMASLYALAIQKRRWEEKLISSLHEKDMLLKEIYHRVKNNLQVISSPLSLQANKIKDEYTKSVFRDSQSRIRSMALVHEKLYQSKNLSRVDYRDYVKTLVEAILHSYGIPRGGITLNYHIDPIEIPLDTAIPCVLIINELGTNSIKYAFNHTSRKEISITLSRHDSEHCILIVSDNGQGMNNHRDIKKSDTLGLQLVTTLVEDQLGGTYEVERSDGTAFVIRFPA